MSAPIATPRPVETTVHGDTRIDEYGWLRDKESSEVLDHLRAENQYTQQMQAHLDELRETIFQEIKGRVLETDLSVPVSKGPWDYYGRTVEGQQYAIHCRRPRGSDESAETEQVLLDENALASDAGGDFFALGTFEVSPDHQRLAYAFDTEGDEIYQLRFRDLLSNEDLEDAIDETAGGIAWSTKADHVFYLIHDESMRPYQLWRHALGTENADDSLVYEETDERFFLGLSTTATDRFILLTCGSQITTEIHVLAADDPLGAWRIVQLRVSGIEYGVDHHVAGDSTERWFGITNDDAENFRLEVDGSPLLFADGQQVTDAAAKLDAFDIFRSHIALYERSEGLERIRIINLDGAGRPTSDRVLAHDDPVHSVWGTSNVEIDSPVIRFGYTSMTTPSGTYEENLATGERVLRKQQPVLGDFETTNYVSERLWATAADGARVPISVVRHVNTLLDGTAPGVLYGYGSYEISIDPTFSVARLSLLDRGFVFAIAHVRGGGEMGRHWYLDGKFLKKRNTFSDFLACADHLVETRTVAPDRLACRGGSAGGLLVGAALNLAPSRFRAAVAEVPFVDSLTTMLDDSLPLTEIEKDEWGDPNDLEFYAYMKSYAPFENVAETKYPSMLVTAGLNDPRVSYWEPAKWVQRLRARSTGGGPILLKTEMGAGHGGPSGRYDGWRDEAAVLAFLVDALSVREKH